MNLEGKAFTITGGCGSIRGTTARAVLAEGGTAMMFDIVPQAQGEDTAKTNHPKRALYFYTQLKILFGQLARLHSRLYPRVVSPVESIDFEKVLRMNAYGTFVVDSRIGDSVNAQYPDDGPFGPRVTQERGCIINIASVVARPVTARCLTYGPSKTCVLGISAGMADLLGPCGIRVNTISPAVVAFALMGDRLPYFASELDASCVFPRRTSDPQEVAEAIVFCLKITMMNDQR